MNIASYRALTDGLDTMGAALQRRRMEDRLRMQQALENARGQREHQLRMMEGVLRLKGQRQGLHDAEEAAADRQLDRQVAPIRAEQQSYDDQRAVVERRLDQAMKRRGELEREIAERQKLNWQMHPDNPANLRSAALAAKAAKVPAPTAKVTEEIGNAKVAYDVPLTEMEGKLRAQSYRSPYADEIAGYDRQIAEQQAEMAGGDTRTGFMGVGTSRQGVIDKAKNQRLQMKALELQDLLEKGIIDQREADRRAAILMRQ